MQELAGLPNPFGDGICSNPWTFDQSRVPDVEAIHKNRYDLCLRLLDQDVRQRASTSLMLTGPFGSGKTHLVGRLFRRFRQAESSIVPCYVSMRELALDGMWTHLRHCLFQDLFQEVRGSVDNLSRMLATRMPEFAGGRTSPQGLFERAAALFGGAGPSLPDLIDQHLHDFPYALRAALRLAYGKQEQDRQLGRSWLRGEWLPPEHTQRLGLPSCDMSDQARNQQSRQVVLSLLRLTTSELPLVVCFDQLEPLKHTLGDRQGFRQLARIAAELRNHGEGRFLLIFFVASAYRDEFLNASDPADRDRLHENEVLLQPLIQAEAAELFITRLEAVPQLKELRARNGDKFWPFDKQGFERLFLAEQGERTPRAFLAKAKAAFETLTNRGGLQTGLSAYLLSRWQERRAAWRGLPGTDLFPRTLNSLPWLAQLLGTLHQRVEGEALRRELPDVSLVLRLPQGPCTAFSVCPKAPNTWQRFERLTNRWRDHLARHKPGDRLVILCDAYRADFQARTQARYDALKALPGVLIVNPPLDHIVAVTALHALFLDATAGEVVQGGLTVTAEAVQHWAVETVREVGTELTAIIKEVFDHFELELTNSRSDGASPVAPRTAQVKT